MRLLNNLEYEPMVSIIVAAYNVQAYIADCVKSLSQQTYNNIEIICIDDCSSDSTGKLLDEMCTEKRYTVVHNQQNLGVSETRNIGLALAKGKWICFVDGDDYTPCTMIETLLDQAEKGNVDVVIGDYFCDNGAEIYVEEFYDIEKEIVTNEKLQIDAILGIKGLRTSVGVPWGKLYRRELIIKHGISFVPGLKRMQDLIFNLYVFQMAELVQVVNSPVYIYRLRSDSATKAYDKDFVPTGKEILDEIKRFAGIYQKSWKEIIALKEIQLVVEAVKLFGFRSNSTTSYKTMIAYIEYANRNLFVDRGETERLGRNMKEKVLFFLLKNEFYNLALLFFYMKYRNWVVGILPKTR